MGKTPNSYKVLILLEESGVDYEIELDDGPNGIKHQNFMKYNPNGRAILSNLAERFESIGKYLGKSLKERTEVSEWLAFHISRNGPTQGQVFWFKFILLRASTGLDRRDYSNPEENLDRPTIADIAFYAWVSIAAFAEIPTDKFPKLQVYVSKLAELPSFKTAASKLVVH
ncbi:hypothetical protein Clacol_004657 [Clathrus columnatus]|uniref:Glutathione S-transferase n=1 Tax=Clathrus columnatus TaxID=1419009 RepID=A0AAV5AD62_9AGAM|nr:hypothetical protein Clacol_004657 [Clathrus columnatus]